MKKLVLFLIIGIVCLGCNRKSKIDRFLKINHHKYLLESTITKLGQLADSTFSDSTSLGSILAFKILDPTGVLKKVEMNEAIQLHLENLKRERVNSYPIFEITNTSKVILAVYGRGMWDKIWGEIVIDTTNFELINLDLDHTAETPGIGARLNELEFKSQFIGTTLNKFSCNYSLNEGDSEKDSGTISINGISGATVTSVGVIEMLNQSLSKYKRYLQK